MLITKKIVIDIILRSSVVLLGLMIVLVSIARAGLEILAKDETNTVISNDTINYLVTFDDGETMSGTYKLPVTGMLPDDTFYGIRQLRDWLWLNFSGGKNKLKIALLLADKNIAEAKALLTQEKYNRAIETGNQAVDKLEYANDLVNGFKVPDDQVKQLHRQILSAGFAYKMIFANPGNAFGIDEEKYTKLINRIDDWNKEQEKNRFSWNY